MFSSLAAGATAALTALRFVMSLGSGLFKHAKADSLISFTKATRVEPITLIDQRAIALPYLHDTLQAVNSIFIGYYLQAVSLMCNVGNINVVKLLDSLNPQRDVADAANTYLVEALNPNRPTVSMNMLSLESYDTFLPVPSETASLEDQNKYASLNRANQMAKDGINRGFGKVVQDMDTVQSMVTGQHAPLNDPNEIKEHLTDVMHGMDGGQMRNLQANAKNAMTGKDGKVSSVGIGFDAVKESTNLSVGKLIEITVSSEGAKATFPIQVRLIATIMASSILSHILGDGSRDVSAKERFHSWRAGALEFWRDIVWAEDLIAERRKALMKDDTGAYAEILARRSGNAAAGILSATPSIGTASNIVILTKQTARELELAIGGRLSDKRTRDKVFNSSYIILLVVLDPDYEQVDIYHRGIALPTKLSIKELKVANKGSGPDIGEILKAYQLGSQITTL